MQGNRECKMISQILAMIPKEKLLEAGKNMVSSVMNKGTEQTQDVQQEQPKSQVSGSKFYYPTNYQGISGIFKSFGGK